MNETGVLKSEGMWLNVVMVLQMLKVITYTFWTVPMKKNAGEYDVIKRKADQEEKSKLLPKPLNPRTSRSHHTELPTA